MKENSKLEARNPKQIRNSNNPIFQTGFMQPVLNFSHSNLFRVSIFGFRVLAFRAAILLFILVGIPTPAHAHLMNTGFGPFCDGLTHLFVTPEDLLQVIALALLAGLRGPSVGRAVLVTLPVSWVFGSIVGLLLTPQWALPAASAVMAIVLGALVAADKRLRFDIIIAITIAAGFVNGALNGMELARTGSSTLLVLGVATSVFVALALLAGQAASLRAMWARTTARVAGSWIAASGLFMLGWALRAT